MDLARLEKIIVEYYNHHSGYKLREKLSTYRQDRVYCDARRILVVIAREYYSYSLNKIGKFLKRNHSTIYYLYKSAFNIYRGDPFNDYLDEIKKIIGKEDVLS